MYTLIRKLLFLLPAEFSHHLGLLSLKVLYSLGLSRLLRAGFPQEPLELLGLRFDNPVGLAAGLDKNGDYIDALGALGFGFIEVGTVTPRPQDGNPLPRLFRLVEEEALINRMGFNNKGVDHLVKRLERRRYRGVVGVNIGKNLTTPVERALDDYLICLRCVYPYADYIVVNLSSPNTPGLRALQFGEHLENLLLGLKEAQQELEAIHHYHVPLLVKIAPDLKPAEVQEIATSFRKYGVEGVIVSNTTISRSGVQQSPWVKEQGGLSGAPLLERSTRIQRQLCKALGKSVPVIGVGGIVDADGARKKVRAGASLLQLYTGFIYRGPALIAEVAAAVREFTSPATVPARKNHTEHVESDDRQ